MCNEYLWFFLTLVLFNIDFASPPLISFLWLWKSTLLANIYEIWWETESSAINDDCCLHVQSSFLLPCKLGHGEVICARWDSCDLLGSEFVSNDEKKRGERGQFIMVVAKASSVQGPGKVAAESLVLGRTQSCWRGKVFQSGVLWWWQCWVHQTGPRAWFGLYLTA